MELLYHKKSSLWYIYESSILIWNMEQELEATYWNGAKNLISTTVYSIACKFDALTDIEELHIQKSLDLPNDTLIFIFELHFGYNMEPPYWIWRCNRTFPKDLLRSICKRWITRLSGQLACVDNSLVKYIIGYLFYNYW